MDTVVAKTFSRNRLHPQKFAMWVACASLLMMFTGLTSAYIVRRAAGNWYEFPIPNVFFVSTIAILLSSMLLHTSYLQFKKGNEIAYKIYLLGGFALGIVFLILQYQGWISLKDMGVPLRTNPSGDFVYVISWIHAAHVVGGIAALIVALIHAFSLKFKVTETRKHRFELTLTYWHFVDFLWIYLIVFFVIQS